MNKNTDRKFYECKECESSFVITIIDSNMDEISKCPFCGSSMIEETDNDKLDT